MPLRVLVWVLLGTAGCGRIGFGLVERDAGAIDATVADAHGRDARTTDAPSVDSPEAVDSGARDAEPAADAGVDFATGPFETAAIVEQLRSTAREDDPSLTADLLEIYFDSDRSGGMGGGDIWMSTRGSLDAPWGAAINVTVLNSTGDDATPDVSPDGLTLHYVTARAGAIGAKDVYVSTRESRDHAWSPPVHVPELSTAGDEAGPSARADSREVYLGSNVAGGAGGDDLYFSVRSSTAVAFGPLRAVDGLNTASNDAEPWISATGQFLAFASNRAGGAGGSDLYITSRPALSDPFETPSALPGVNTSADETDPWLSADGTVLFFARGGDIYTATR